MQGEAEKGFRYALKMIERMSPCVLLGDEYDKTLSSMAGNSAIDGGVGSSLLSIWLEWIEKPTPAIFIGTSNSLNIRPEEMRRLEVFFVDFPDKSTTTSILWSSLVCNKVIVSYDDVANLSEKMSPLFTGDLIKKVIDTAVTNAGVKKIEPGIKDLEGAYLKYLDRAISFHINTSHIRENATAQGLQNVNRNYFNHECTRKDTNRTQIVRIKQI